MRLAFVDIVFSWPPLGGAPLDLYYTMAGLQALGHEVHLFYGEDRENWRLDPVQEEKLPFAATKIPYSREEMRMDALSGMFRNAVDRYRPDAVFQCFGFFMKPYISAALSHYPQIARYYAYEPFCPRDYRLFWKRKTCPKNYLRTPNVCRRCAYRTFKPEIRFGNPAGYTLEYQRTEAWTPAYYAALTRSLREYRAVIVYNHFTKGLLTGFNDNIHVIGGGVHLDEFTFDPLSKRPANGKSVIFMSGRANDPTKGLKTLLKAGALLWKERQDFEIWATLPESPSQYPFFKALGWNNFERIMEFYRQADICVAPSLWEEPFGLVAVEAMAIGRPCVVSNVGGLQEIVRHGETGYVFERNQPRDLARCLSDLLNNPARRAEMGVAGRKRVEALYDWQQVVQRHYPPLLEEIMR